MYQQKTSASVGTCKRVLKVLGAIYIPFAVNSS